MLFIQLKCVLQFILWEYMLLRYVGQYQEGFRSGYGTYYYKDGRSFVGIKEHSSTILFSRKRFERGLKIVDSMKWCLLTCNQASIQATKETALAWCTTLMAGVRYKHLSIKSPNSMNQEMNNQISIDRKIIIKPIIITQPMQCSHSRREGQWKNDKLRGQVFDYSRN